MTQLRLAHVNLQLVSKPKAARFRQCETCSTHFSGLPESSLELARLHAFRPDEAKVIAEMIARLLAEVVPPDER